MQAGVSTLLIMCIFSAPAGEGAAGGQAADVMLPRSGSVAVLTMSGAQHLGSPASPPTGLLPAASLYTPLLVLPGAAVWNLHTYDIVLANPVLVLVIANLGILFSVGG